MSTLSRTLKRLCNWGNHIARWQLGWERSVSPELNAVQNAAEARLLYRVELNALAGLLIQKGVFTKLEFIAQLDVEAERVDEDMERIWPGAKAVDEGLLYDLVAVAKAGWMQ